MRIYKELREHKYLWQIFTLLLMMGLNAHHALAVIPHVISIGCPGTTVPTAPQDLMRIKGDSEPWSFDIKPEPGVIIDHQVWTYRNKDGNEPNWGTFTGGDNFNTLTWSSPKIADHFTINVKAKRHCAGGGEGDDNFEITWQGDIATFEYHAENQASFLRGYLISVGTFAPIDQSESQDGIRVTRGQTLTLRDNWIDKDFRGPVDSPAKSWEEVPGTGTYTITATTNGVGISFQEGQIVQSKDFSVDAADGNYGNIDPGNIYAYVTDTWNGQPFDITLSIKDSGKVPEGSIGVPQDTDKTDPANLTKHFVKGKFVPKNLNLLTPPSTGVEGEQTISASSNVVYCYQGEPGTPPGEDDPGPSDERPFYDGQAVDETFGTFSPTFTLDDLTTAWKNEYSPLSAGDAFVKIFGLKLINTSFTLHTEDNYVDIFKDPYKFVPDTSQLSAFTTAAQGSGNIGYEVNQIYTSGQYQIGSFHAKLSYNAVTNTQTISKTRLGN